MGPASKAEAGSEERRHDAVAHTARNEERDPRCSPDAPPTTHVRMTLQNVNPSVFQRRRARHFDDQAFSDDTSDEIDAREVFDLIRDIKDPEHPLTLEELNVVSEEHISVDSKKHTALVRFSPTVAHCSLATLIGLAIQVKLLRCLPPGFKIDVRIAQGTHSTEDAVNKQLGDKERVAAALENPQLLRVVNQCIVNS